MNLFFPVWLIYLAVLIAFVVVIFLIVGLAYWLFEWADNLKLFYNGAQRELSELREEIEKLNKR